MKALEPVALRVLPIPLQIGYILGGAAVCLAITLTGVALYENAPYNAGGGTTAWVYNPRGLAGLVLFTTFVTLSVVLLYEGSQVFVRYAWHPKFRESTCGRPLRCLAMALQLLLSLVYAGVGSAAMAKWGTVTMRCGVLFCLNSTKYPAVSTAPRGTAFNFLHSAMLFFTLIPLALVMWWRLGCLLCGEIRGDNSKGAAAPVKPQALRLRPQPRRLVWRVCSLVGLIAVICVFALFTFWLPNDSRKYVPNALALYAALGINKTAPSTTMTTPELPTAWMRSGQLRVSSTLTLKLYPSTMLFYGYLILTSVAVFVVRETQRGSYWAARRPPGPLRAFTVAELIFVATTALLCTLFFIYWVHDHNYRVLWRGSTTSGSPMLAAETWGRSLGQLAVLFLSLLFIPISRRSIVMNVLGISRDGLLWFHRAVGYAMLLATLGHMIAFYACFASYGTLLTNLNVLPMVVGYSAVRGDFTVIVVQWTTWLLLISMGLFGLNYVRRYCYELFYYTHLIAAYASLSIILLHAHAGWMYLLPGITTWFVDQLARIFQRSAVVKVVHARVIGEDSVELAFAMPGRWDMRCVHPGQYVLVCVPELSSLQWHPFTLTNVIDEGARDTDANGTAEGDGTVFYVHIKSMGPKTWTARLHDLVRTGQAFSMAVEGPCGAPMNFERYDDVVLVAGGIGVTPCASIFGSFLRAHRAGGGAAPAAPRVPRVHAIWSTRCGRHVNAIANMLQLPVRCEAVLESAEAASPAAGAANACTAEAERPRRRSGDFAAEAVPDPNLCPIATKFCFDVFLTRAADLVHVAGAEEAQEQCGTPATEGRGEAYAELDDGLPAPAVPRLEPRSMIVSAPGFSQQTLEIRESEQPSRVASPPHDAALDVDTEMQEANATSMYSEVAPPSEVRPRENTVAGGTAAATTACAPPSQLAKPREANRPSGSSENADSPVQQGLPLAAYGGEGKRVSGVSPTSRRSSSADDAIAMLVHMGRPDVEALVRCAVGNAADDGETCAKARTLLFVCGPQPLVDHVLEIGAKLAIPVHTEVFVF